MTRGSLAWGRQERPSALGRGVGLQQLLVGGSLGRREKREFVRAIVETQSGGSRFGAVRW